MRYFIIFFCLLFFVCTSLLADSLKKSDLRLKDTTAAFAKISDAKYLTEADAYKLLYENTLNSNGSIISITQWAIGLAFGFLIVIIGSQFLYSHRINTKEISNIKSDMENRILSLKDELISDITRSNDIAKSDLDKKMTGLDTSLKDLLKERFEAKMRFFDLRIDSTEKRIETEVKQLGIELEKNKGDIWLLKGVSANALSSFLRSALFQIDLNREMKYILDDIISILSSLEEIHQHDEELLNRLVEKLDVKCLEQKDKIVSLYKSKAVYRFVDGPSKVFAELLGGGPVWGNKQYIKNVPGNPKGFAKPPKL
jgi:hypothetical protein